MNLRDISLFIVFFFACNYSFAQQSSEDDLLAKINLDLPQLATVKKYVQSNQNKLAMIELLKQYRSKENVYLNVSKDDLSYIKSHYKNDVEKTLKTADEVLNLYFLFRYDWDMEKTNIPHQFEKEIDWTAMPNGDEEWCFMLNRHRYWLDLGKAYLLTKDEKYAKAFVQQASHWIDENPFEDRLKFLTWRRIEAGLRCENWVKTLEYFKNSETITPQFFSKFLNSLHQHGKLLNSAFSSFSRTSNWGVIEFNGLYTLSHLLPEFSDAQQWQKNAEDHLTTCIGLQVLQDGTHWEQSPMYHNEVFHCYLNINFTAQKIKLELPSLIVEKTKALAYANVEWQKPNFHQPLLGDSDDTDTRGILTTAAYLFSDPRIKSRAYADFDYENMFLFGKSNLKKYKKIDSINPDFGSVYQQSSGDLYMRSSWSKDASYTSFHMKNLGCGHGHDNLLHFNLFANGRDYLVDCGRYSYPDNKWRRLFKSNKSHNTLGVDNLPNSIYQNNWQNSYEAKSYGLYTQLEDFYDYGEAVNTAYKRLEDPVSMTRRLLFLKELNVWLIFDSFSANKTHTYSQYFNFPNKKVRAEKTSVSSAYENDNLKIQAINNADVKLSDAWYSPEYNLKNESIRAEFSKTATGFDSFITLLYFPEQTKLSYSKVAVYNRNKQLLTDKDAEAVSIKIDDTEYILIVRHNFSENFFIVNDQFLSGEVILLKKEKQAIKKYIIKE